MVTSYHRVLRYNTTIKENDNELPWRPLLLRLLLLLRHRKEGDNNLLPSPSLFQQYHKRK
jgi:hypothetical protein